MQHFVCFCHKKLLIHTGFNLLKCILKVCKADPIPDLISSLKLFCLITFDGFALFQFCYEPDVDWYGSLFVGDSFVKLKWMFEF